MPMRPVRIAVVLVAALLSLPALADTKAQEEKVQKLLPALKKITADPALLKAVKAQNAKKMPAAEVQKLDKEWMAATGISPFMKGLLDNPTSAQLKKLVKDIPACTEAFVMDDQGGLVGSISKTSDYWQGDEAKWQKSFAEGKGADFIDKLKFDESSQTYSVQVSVPVMDGGKAVGAITFGLAVEKL